MPENRLGFEIEVDILERERHRLTVFFEAQAKEIGVVLDRTHWHITTMNICDRIWDGRLGDRWINIDLNLYERSDGFTKKFGLDDEIDLLSVQFPPDKVPLDLAWNLHRVWLYDRIDVAEMNRWLDHGLCNASEDSRSS